MLRHQWYVHQLGQRKTGVVLRSSSPGLTACWRASRERTFYEKFSNRSVVGRTGRGDTTFAAYLARRIDHNAAEALKFAAALVSIKMEPPGPFNETLDDVLARMR